MVYAVNFSTRRIHRIHRSAAGRAADPAAWQAARLCNSSVKAKAEAFRHATLQTFASLSLNLGGLLFVQPAALPTASARTYMAFTTQRLSVAAQAKVLEGRSRLNK